MSALAAVFPEEPTLHFTTFHPWPILLSRWEEIESHSLVLGREGAPWGPRPTCLSHTQRHAGALSGTRTITRVFFPDIVICVSSCLPTPQLTASWNHRGAATLFIYEGEGSDDWMGH